MSSAFLCPVGKRLLFSKPQKLKHMKTINFFKTALLTIALFVCGNTGAQISIVPDKTTTNTTSGSYIATETTFSANEITYKINNWNPSTLQVRGNKSTTNNLQSGENFYFRNTSALPGHLTKITINKKAGTLNADKIYLQTGDNEITNQTMANSIAGTDNNGSVSWNITNPYTFFAISFTNGATSGTTTIQSIEITYSTEAIAVLPPTFSPQTGKYTQAQNVTINCATAEASIYYTLDKTEPSAESTLYNGAINISSTTTLKAIAIKNGESSAVATATYTFPTEVDNIAAFNQAENNDFVKITKPITVTYINGANVYAQDESGSMLIYDFNFAETEGLTNGSIINNIAGENTLYNGAPQMKNVFSYTLSGHISIIDPTTVETLSAADVHKYVKLEDAQFNNSYSFTESSAINANLNTHGNIVVRNNFRNFNMDVNSTDKYDIVGFVSVYNNTPQIYPVSIVVTTPSITVSTNSLAFETVENNQTKDLTFTVNGANLSENATLAISGANAGYFTCTPTSITPAEDGSIAETTITVTYQPTATGEHAATLTLTCGDLTKEVALTGTCISPILATPVATEATAITVNGFTANWEAVENATSYEVNVWTEEEPAFSVANSSFENGLENWDAEEGYSLSTDNAHTGSQSLAFDVTKRYGLRQTIENLTPGEEITLSYWYYLNETSSGSGLRFWCSWVGNDDHSALQPTTYTNEKGAWTQATITTTVPEGATALNLEIRVYNGAKGYIDDITVTPANGNTITPITGSPFTVEGATSKEITGLTAETTYYYNVVAKAEGYTASESNTISVTTTAEVAEPTITITGDDLVETEGRYTVALGETRFSTKTSKTFTLTATGILEPIKIKPEIMSGYFTIISSDSDQASIVEEMDFFGNVNKTLTFTPNETGEINAVCTISNRINSEFADYGVSNGEEMMQMFELTFGTPLTEQWGILYQNQTANITKVITVSLTPTEESTGTGLCNQPEMEGITFNGEEIINSLNLDVVVYNAVGQMVVRSNENINMSSYPAGVYVIKAANGESMKIVK